MPANYTKTSSPPLSNTQPCLAPVSLALQQVTNYSQLLQQACKWILRTQRIHTAQLSLGCSGSHIPALTLRLSWEPDPPFSGPKEGGAEISALNFPSYTDCQRKDGSWELKSQHLEKARAGQAKIHLPAKPGALEPGNKDA